MFTVEFLSRNGNEISVVATESTDKPYEKVMQHAEELIESGHFGPRVAQGFRLLDAHGVIVTSWILPGEYRA